MTKNEFISKLMLHYTNWWTIRNVCFTIGVDLSSEQLIRDFVSMYIKHIDFSDFDPELESRNLRDTLQLRSYRTKYQIYNHDLLADLPNHFVESIVIYVSFFVGIQYMSHELNDGSFDKLVSIISRMRFTDGDRYSEARYNAMVIDNEEILVELDRFGRGLDVTDPPAQYRRFMRTGTNWTNEHIARYDDYLELNQFLLLQKLRAYLQA